MSSRICPNTPTKDDTYLCRWFPLLCLPLRGGCSGRKRETAMHTGFFGWGASESDDTTVHSSRMIVYEKKNATQPPMLTQNSPRHTRRRR